VLSPSAGSIVEFGTTVNLEWTATANGYYRVELWRFGNFETRLIESKFQYAGASSTMNWHVFPGPSADDASEKGTLTSTFNSQQPGTYDAASASSTPQKPETTPTWFHFFDGLKPGDHYTIRVCGYSEDPNEQICDNVYGESGEFDIKGVIDMLSPVRQNTYQSGDFIPITWQSYWMGSTVDLKIFKDGAVVFKDIATSDDGVYTFYVTPDMAPGTYEITVAKAGEQCGGGSCKTFFTMLAHPSPPPMSSPPPSPPPSPKAPGADNWEVPIIQAFKGSFGLDEIKDGPGAHTDYGTTSTVAGGINCDYVCHVYQTQNGIVGRRSRRLLFGGLQYYDAADTNAFVGCSEDMKKCGCC